MATVYIDSVWLLNTLADYLLLLVTARLSGIPLRRRRYFAAAFAGGTYAAAVFLPGFGFLSAVPVKAAMGILLALLAYGGEERLLRLTLLFFGVSCGFAGCTLGLGTLLGGIPVVNGIFYTDVNTKTLAAAFGAGYLAVSFVFRSAARHGVRGELIRVRLCVDGRWTELTALRDSGNTLRDPVSGGSVLVLSPEAAQAALPWLTADLLNEPAELLQLLMKTNPRLLPRLLPYRAVGTTGGLLLSVALPQAEIGGVRCIGLRAALSPTELGNGYSALWGGETGGRYDKAEKNLRNAAAPAGQAGGDSSLHWRQRYPAAAFEP